MKLNIFLLIAGLSLPVLVIAQHRSLNKKLSATIDSLRNADQAPAGIQDAKAAGEAFKVVTRSNLPVLVAIFNRFGFPGYDLAGKESSHNYWLCVQHSDFNLDFQKKVLAAMKGQVMKGNASGQDYAYLTDRINLNEGHEQIYGTQIIMGPKGTKLRPCMDSLNLDKRRLSVGLTPVKTYLIRCDSIFYAINKDRGVVAPLKDSTKH